MADVKWGLFVPQGWKMDLEKIEDPVDQFEAMTAVAKRADRGPWDSVWVYDHFHSVPEPLDDVTVFEAWTSTACLVRDTERVKVGQMVSCNGYRNPALYAKIASTVDVAAHGRLYAGIGAGWYEHEWRAYGYGFPDVPPRMRMFKEAVQIMHKMWTEDGPTFKGEFYSIDKPINEPKSHQPGEKVNLWIGGGGEKVTLKLVAQYADACNVGRDPEVCRHKLDVLRQHCEKLGRNDAEIIKSAELDAVIVHDGEDADAIRAAIPNKDWAIVGTLDEVRAHCQALIDAGINYIIVYLPDVATNHELITEFERDVIDYFA